MPQPQGPRLPAPRLHPPHAAKTMQSRMMFSDRLLGIPPALSITITFRACQSGSVAMISGDARSAGFHQVREGLSPAFGRRVGFYPWLHITGA
jgi:hypothetical protein